MNKFRVTCLLDFVDSEEPRRVFATRTKFTTREAAKSYADTISPDRKPMVAYCQFFTNYDMGHWTVYDPDEYDGPGGEVSTTEGDRFDELAAVWEFCETFDRCGSFFYGVPCGGRHTAPDEAGSGYMRCDKCGML